MDLASVCLVDEPVARDEGSANIGKTPRLDHVVDDRLVVPIVGFSTQRGDRQRAVPARGPPGKTENLLESHRGAIVFMNIVELAATAAAHKGSNKPFVVVRHTESNNAADPAAPIAAPYALQEAAYASRRIAQHDGVHIADVDPDLQCARRYANPIALRAHFFLDTLPLPRREGAEVEVDGPPRALEFVMQVCCKSMSAISAVGKDKYFLGASAVEPAR
jgi:hypothetical protein